MISRIRSAGIIAAMMLIGAVIVSDTALAQVFFPNPPCAVVVVSNTTGCAVNMRFVTMPAVWPVVVPIPAFGTVNLAVPAGGITVNGINSLGAFFYPVLAPPPPAGSTCGAADFSINHVRVGPPPGCCVDICFLPGQCAIVIRPSPPPPMCNP